jgi:hypothetical protein
VPPGFTITTEACREYLASGNAPAMPLWPGGSGSRPVRKQRDAACDRRGFGSIPSPTLDGPLNFVRRVNLLNS